MEPELVPTCGMTWATLLALDSDGKSFTKGLARRQRPGNMGQVFGIAGWSSPVARQAHNLKVVGSNPTPATNIDKTVIPQSPPPNVDHA